MSEILVPRRPHASPTIAVAIGALLTACLVGFALAVEIPLGLALLLAIIYLPLVFTNFPIAVCLWIPIVFLEGLPAFNLAGKAAGLILLLGWLAALRSRVASREVITRHRRLFEVACLLAAWLTLSLAWAPNTAQALGGAWRWWAVVLVLAMVGTAVTSARIMTFALGAYVAGAVVGLGVSVASGGVASEDDRIASSVGDPNFLAATLVSAIPLAFALAVIRPTVGFRALCFAGVAFLSVGVVVSQSRSGLVAGIATWIAAVVVLPRRRYVVAGGAMVLSVVVVAFAMNPGAWNRVTEEDTSGSGRVDIWTVAWSIFRDNPVQGVGVSNFGRVAPEYVRDVGPLENVQSVVKAPDRTVHNSYLELLAESGIPALVLFLVVVVGCLRASLRAAKMFAALGRTDLVAVSHALFLGSTGLLASYFFQSPAVDRRLWILLGLSLAALGIAHTLGARSLTRTAADP